ncbi:FHA domain-containing protein [Streptomyces zingiberis]|uniref:FHA domain-containing protein n=1 Tax=Streptomyces zingiberis TaxID=2053010 RepID=A0ABX1C2B0_9ACTN|nr:FHA domain-containing protein [Streptomyces zingiberis]NJQ02077.1 FHA domain-containing protein [Streptomyces zingiberis]
MRELVLEWNERTWTLEPSRAYAVGRDPRGDVVLDDPRVSWRHATIRWDGAGWVAEDHGSTNGTYTGGVRTERAALGAGTTLHLGSATDGPVLAFSAAPAAAPAPSAGPPAAHQAPAPQAPAPPQGGHPAHPGHHAPQQYHAPAHHAPPHQALQPHAAQFPAPGHSYPGAAAPAAEIPHQGGPHGQPPAAPGTAQHGGQQPTGLHPLALGRVLRIGRALENDLVVSDLQVSRHHAEFRSTPDGQFEIVDLGSHNGTYVNGQPVGRQILGAGDVVGVGHSTFRLVGDRLEEFVDTGEVSFSARHLTVTVDGGKEILKDVSFGVPEKSLIAVIGPSGSGKSTLLRALTGYRPADRGQVLYDHRDLYTEFAELRQRIGLVPQDDILHKELTVRTALRYAAKLRFPGDTAAAEREARIDEVLGELKLDIHKDKKVTSLSGGQRKRVSVALELLTKPSLIFLDEPTSGLDPGMDRDVMQLLRGLADDGRTVLVVTHSVAELALCDKLLVLAPGGSVAYFGPPDEALNFFGYSSWADVFSAFENYRDHDWSGRWQGSQHYQLYAAELDATAAQPASARPRQLRPPAQQSWGSQLWTLIRRYASVIASDKGFMGLLVVLPVVLGVVSVLIPADHGLAYGPEQGNPPFSNRDGAIVLLILAVGACFTGAANSVRELIKERVIYERERATGLSRSAYLMSKVIVLGVITAFQGALISAIGLVPRDLPEEGVILRSLPGVELALPIMALGFTSMMVGLIISALVRTAEKTMPLLVMSAIVQLVFTGCLFQLNGKVGAEQLAWLVPSRWGVSAAGSTADLNWLLPWEPGTPDPLWEHDAATWLLDMGVLLGIGLVCCVLVARLLRRHEPEVMRR